MDEQSNKFTVRFTLYNGQTGTSGVYDGRDEAQRVADILGGSGGLTRYRVEPVSGLPATLAPWTDMDKASGYLLDALAQLTGTLERRPALAFRDAVRQAMADLTESHGCVPMTGDGFALVRSSVAKLMHISDVRLQVRPLDAGRPVGSGAIRIVLDDLRAPQFMDWPEESLAVIGRSGFVAKISDTDRAIAYADRVGGNPGSKPYMETALQALPGVTEAHIYDHTDHTWIEVGSVAIVVGGGLDVDIAEVINQTSPAGLVMLGRAVHMEDYVVKWFTARHWELYGMALRPLESTFTESCARCGTLLLYAEGCDRRDSVIAHKAKCFAKGDAVRWTSPASADLWVDGTVVGPVDVRHDNGLRRLVRFSSASSSWESPCALIGATHDVAVSALSHHNQTNHTSIGPAIFGVRGALRNMDSIDSAPSKAPLMATIVADAKDPYTWRFTSIDTKTGEAVPGPVALTIDPLDIDFDDVTLRVLIERDRVNAQEGDALFHPFSPTQRAAVSAYQSDQLRAKVAKSEADRKARETSVVIGVDPEDL